MVKNSNQPRVDDAVMGGGFLPLVNAAVLGGIEGVKQRLASESDEVRIAALKEALNYGKEGLRQVIQIVKTETGTVQKAAYELLWARASEKGKQSLLKYNRSDLAENKPVKSSGYYEDGIPERAVEHHPNNNWNWRTDDSTGAWLSVDLGDTFLISRVVVSWGWDWKFGPNAESWIQISDDEKTWQTVATTTTIRSTNNSPQTLTFPQVKARYVRFYAARWNGGWGYLTSLEVYQN
jgi:hypothetical protein